MRKLKAIILLLIAFATQVVAQSTVHLCAGTNHNFGVPYTVGSSYNWQVQANTAIATITSGNGSITLSGNEFFIQNENDAVNYST